jgi:hypothetical protein
MQRRGRFRLHHKAVVNTGTTPQSDLAHHRYPYELHCPRRADYEEVSSAVARNVFAVLWQGDFRQGIQTIHRQLVKDDGLKKFWLLIYADKYMWMKEHLPTRTRHFSIVYGSLQRARDAMVAGTVCFYQEAPILD